MAVGTGTALLLGSLAAAGTSVYSASQAGKAADTQAGAATDAAQAQVEAAQISADTIREMYQQGREDVAPWRQAGEFALQRLTGLTPATAASTNAIQAPTTTQPGQNAIVAPTQSTAVQAPTLVRPQDITYQMLNGDEQTLYSQAYENLSMTPGLGVNDQLVRAVLGPEFWKAAADRINRANTVDQIIETGQIPVATTQNQETPQNALTSYTPSGQGLLEGPGEFTASPGYQFRLQEGINAIDRGAAARGNLLSGQHSKDLMAYGQGLASDEHQNFLANYYRSLDPWFQLAGLGQGSASQTANLAQNTGANLAATTTQGANALASGILGAGQATASGYQNQANILTGGANNMSNALLLYQLLNS